MSRGRRHSRAARQRNEPPESGDPFFDSFRAWLAVGEVPPSLNRFVAERIRALGWVGDARAGELVRFLDACAAWGVLAASPSAAEGPEALVRAASGMRRPRDLLELWRREGPAFAERIRAIQAGKDAGRAALATLGCDHDDPEVRLLARMLAAGVPPWHQPSLARRATLSGDDWVEGWLARQGTRPPLWLRAADFRRLPVVRNEIAVEGLRVLRTEGAGLAVEGDVPVMSTRAWQQGRVEVQDLASQRVGEAVPLRPGDRVWDACAGNGGKTMQLWSRLGGKEGQGTVYATDAAPQRLQELRRRAGRAGAEIRTALWDGRTTPELPAEIVANGGFDHALVDAPCSGSGTWRRQPDARLRSQPGALRKLAAVQLALLDAASRAVRQGGTVSYATCSAWVEENEEVVDAFLVLRPQWKEERRSLLGAPAEDADTLFVAVLRRQG
jgi:16S rRNA C967 or C1407 C5-methylase (RsmB/RsmF family)